MTTTKQLRQIAWNHEFELADDEACATHGRLGRVQPLAVHRTCRGTDTNGLPKQRPAAQRREPIHVARGAPDLSRHGRTRLRQRGIGLEQVLAVLDYGREQRAHGASRYFLDRSSRQRLAVEMPTVLRRLHTLDIHVVISDEGSLITAAHRTRRIRREIQYNRRRNDD